MRLELSNDEAVFLRTQLTRHLQEVEDELVHSENREIQHALATDLERLKQLVQRLDTHLREASTTA